MDGDIWVAQLLAIVFEHSSWGGHIFQVLDPAGVC